MSFELQLDKGIKDLEGQIKRIRDDILDNVYSIDEYENQIQDLFELNEKLELDLDLLKKELKKYKDYKRSIYEKT